MLLELGRSAVGRRYAVAEILLWMMQREGLMVDWEQSLPDPATQGAKLSASVKVQCLLCWVQL